MLRKIPDSVVAFARDGVLPASALRQASRADRLERYARGRARRWLEAAQHEADELRAQAIQVGYEDGFCLAVTQLVPILAEAMVQESVLKAHIQAEMEQFVRRLLCDAGVEAAVIDLACQAAAALEEGPDPWTLYVPGDRAELVARLSASVATPVLRVREGEAAYPVLERGDLVMELDVQRPALIQIAQVLDEQLLIAHAQQRASDYMQGVEAVLRTRRTQAGLRATHTTEATTW